MLPFEVFYKKSFFENALSFAAVACRFRITIDTDIDNVINVHMDDVSIIKFKQFSRVLCYYDTNNMKNNTTINQVTD